MRGRLSLVVIGLVAMALLLAGSGTGAPGAEPARLARVDQPKLDSRLAQIVQAATARGSGAAVAEARTAGLGVESNGVRVIVQAKTGKRSAADAAIADVGGKSVGRAGGLTEALVPVASLETLAASPAVSEVRPPALHAANAVDEAVHVSDAEPWHTAGIDGSGVKIAIVDLGFAGYTSLLGTALPASVTTIDHCGGNLAAAPPTGTKHGTAVAELVHQMAPGAQLYLICVDSEVGLAQAEQDAIADGVKIINHSVSWFDTSRGDGTGAAGTPDAIVADAQAHGILWVNAAGNYGEDHWEGTLRTGQAAVMFPGSLDSYDRVTIAQGETACAGLKWDAWPVTTEDFDLGLVRMSDGAVVASSANDQADGPSAPVEELCYTNPDATQTFGLEIVRYSSAGSPRLDLFYLGASALQTSNDGGVTEPASSPYALAVGAECWASDFAENYSSTGPTIDGRAKPDLTAQDSVSTETYGPYPTPTGANSNCGVSGFAGTSAAAPQVAGAAALLLQHDPTLSPAGVTATLQAAARKTAPNPWGALTPVDNTYGGGLLTMPPLTPQRRIAAARVDYGAQSGVMTMNEDGSGARFVTSGTDWDTQEPTWSPDGRTIAYADTRSTSHTRLVDADGANNRTSNTVGMQIDPAWSPDGTSLAFSDGSDIWLAPPGNEASTNLTADGTATRDVQPAWSPDGTKIAWCRDSHLWVMNADGSDETELTAAACQHPAWSPDGTKIVFISSDVHGYAIATIDANGDNLTTLTNNSVDASSRPVWTPDGASIIYGFGQDWFELPAAGGSPTWLRDFFGGGQYAGAAFQPAGVLTTTPENDVVDPLSGDAVVGGSLTEAYTGWTGVVPMTFAFQWQRCDSSGSSCADIPGAVSSSYTPTLADVGSELTLVVTATNVNGSASATVTTAAPIIGSRPYATAAPATSGSAASGSTLAATTGTWQNASSPFTYQWLRCASDGGACAPISGATSDHYTLGGSDVGSTVRAAVGEPWNGTTIWSSSPQTATVSGSSGGGGGGGGSTDVVIGMSASPSSPGVGDTLTYVLTAHLASGVASDVVAHVELPHQVTLLSATADRGSGCTGTTMLTCDLNFLSGSLVATVRIVTHVDMEGTLAAWASLTTTPPDVNTANNEITVTTVAGASPAPATTGSTATAAAPPKAKPKPRLAPPRLRAATTRRLAALRHVTTETFATTFVANEALHVTMSISRAGAKAKLWFLPKTQLARAVTRTRLRFVHATLPHKGTYVVRALLPRRALVRNKTYVLRIHATNAAHHATTLVIRFRA